MTSLSIYLCMLCFILYSALSSSYQLLINSMKKIILWILPTLCRAWPIHGHHIYLNKSKVKWSGFCSFHLFRWKCRVCLHMLISENTGLDLARTYNLWMALVRRLIQYMNNHEMRSFISGVQPTHQPFLSAFVWWLWLFGSDRNTRGQHKSSCYKLQYLQSGP